MKKELVINIVKKYLKMFPDEKQRLAELNEYLANNSETSMCDWNNTNGHLTAGGFLYSFQTKRFLVLWHKDLKMFLYPGGHCESKHPSPLATAKAEIKEETGIANFKAIKALNNSVIPIDIDSHLIPYNNRIKLSAHYHFDFRYLFVVDNEPSVAVDSSEIASYKWVDERTLAKDKNFGSIIKKLKKLI